MPIPDYQRLMLPVLRLAAEGGERRVPEVAGRIADDLGLTPAERAEMLPSGRQSLLNNRVHWAKFYMSKAGLIASPSRGNFVATARGRQLLGTHPDRIDVPLLMREPEFRSFSRNEVSPTGAPEPLAAYEPVTRAASTPEERVEAAHAEIHASLRRERGIEAWQTPKSRSSPSRARLGRMVLGT